MLHVPMSFYNLLLCVDVKPPYFETYLEKCVLDNTKRFTYYGCNITFFFLF